LKNENILIQIKIYFIFLKKNIMIKKILDNASKSENNLLNEATAVNDVKLLLDENAMNDLHLLQNAFPTSANNKLIISKGEEKHLKKLEEMHNGSIYSYDEIKNVCLKYRLRFL
jgi:hypothetical protein